MSARVGVAPPRERRPVVVVSCAQRHACSAARVERSHRHRGTARVARDAQRHRLPGLDAQRHPLRGASRSERPARGRRAREGARREVVAVERSRHRGSSAAIAPVLGKARVVDRRFSVGARPINRGGVFCVRRGVGARVDRSFRERPVGVIGARVLPGAVEQIAGAEERRAHQPRPNAHGFGAYACSGASRSGPRARIVRFSSESRRCIGDRSAGDRAR